MTYYKRIREEDLPANYVDGSVLLHTDMNKLEKLTKDGINANYEDIQKLQDGTIMVDKANTAVSATTATSATMLDTATLSKSTDGDLPNSDEKVSTSKQVKVYVDNALVSDVNYNNLSNKPQINGVTLSGNKSSADLGLDVPFYYFNGENTAENVAMFNELCDKFDDGEKFILVGKIDLENGYTYQGEFHERTIPVLTPFNVKDFTDYEEEGETYYSFMTEPVRTTGGYAIGSIKLTGTWGNFTAITPITWSYDEGPVKKGDLATVATSGDYTDLSNKPAIPADRYLGMVDDYNSTAKALNLSNLENGIYFLGLSGGNSAAHYYQTLYVKAGSRTGSTTFDGKVNTGGTTPQNDFGIVILNIFNHKTTSYSNNEPIGFIQTPSKISGNYIYINNEAITYGTNNIEFIGGGYIRVPSKTSDLTNDGADGTHPFIANYDNSNLKGLGINNGRLSWLNGIALTNVDVANYSDLTGKQDTLVSGTNIKTINNTSLLGSGNIDIQGGGTPTDVQVNGTSIVSSGTANINTQGTYNASTNKIATVSDLGDYKFYYLLFTLPNGYTDTNWTSGSVVEKAETIINECIANNKTPIIFNRYGCFYCDTSVIDWSSTPSPIYFNGLVMAADNSANRTGNSTANHMLKMTVSFTVSYNNGVATVSKVSVICNNTQYISINNSYAYTPSSSYHPATKKYVDEKVSSFTELHLLEYQGNDYRVVSITGDCGEKGTYVWDDLNSKFELQFSDSDSTVEINTGFCSCFVIIKSPYDAEDGDVFGYIPWFYNSTDGEFQFIRLQRNSLESSGMTLVSSTTELATVTYVNNAINSAITTTLGGSY